MTAVLDRPRATTAPARGYRGFHSALDDRCEHALAAHLAADAPAGTPSWLRAADALTLAARIVEMHGMPPPASCWPATWASTTASSGRRLAGR